MNSAQDRLVAISTRRRPRPAGDRRSAAASDAGPLNRGSARGARAPKFALAVPSWFWYLGFFVVPLVFIVVYSFGDKLPVSRPGLDRPRTGSRSTTTATRSNGTSSTCSSQTLRISLIGTALCLLIGFPSPTGSR